MPTTVTVDLGAPLLGSGTPQTFRQVRALTQYLTPGRVRPTDFMVRERESGANMSVNVDPGYAWVKGTTITGPKGQYLYGVPMTGTVNLSPIIAPNSGTRIDSVVLRVYDSTDTPGYGDANAAQLEYYTNPVVNGSPQNITDPNVLVLATVSVAAGAGSIADANITNTAISGLRIPGEDGNLYRLGVNFDGFLGMELTF